MLARLVTQPVEHGPFQFDGALRGGFPALFAKGKFGKNDQIESAMLIPLFGLNCGLIDQLLGQRQPVAQASRKSERPLRR